MKKTTEEITGPSRERDDMGGCDGDARDKIQGDKVPLIPSTRTLPSQSARRRAQGQNEE
jgi:hypothetical protein